MKGDFTPGKTVIVRFNTHKADGTPITLAGTPACSVYKNSTTESMTGVTLTVDYDARTGLHHVAIDTSADGTFYAAGNDFDVVITTGTVDSISVVGTVVGSFSLSNRSALRPTTADRTLDVTAGGEAGIDLDNTAGALGTAQFDASFLAASLIATDAFTAANFAADVWTEARTAINGGDWALDTDANGRIRIVDGTGAGELDTASGLVALTAAAINAIADQVWDEARSGHVTAGTFGEYVLGRLADGVTHGGTTAMLRLGASSTTPALYVTNSHASTAAVQFESSGLSAAGFRAHNSSTGPGMTISSTAGPGLGIEASDDSGIVVTASDKGIAILGGTADISLDGAGVIDGNLSGSVGSVAADGISAASLAADAGTEIGTAVWGSAIRTLTALGFTLAASDLAADVITAAKVAADFWTEGRVAINGGDRALDTDANGRIRIVDGTGTGELDTAAGLVKISGTIQTLDALNTGLVAEHDATQALVAASAIRAAVGLASANLDTQLDALPTAAENAAGLLDLTDGIETGITPRQLLRGVGSALFGIVQNAGSGTETFKAAGAASGGTTRLTYTVDSSGNRTAVTLNL